MIPIWNGNFDTYAIPFSSGSFSVRSVCTMGPSCYSQNGECLACSHRSLNEYIYVYMLRRMGRARAKLILTHTHSLLSNKEREWCPSSYLYIHIVTDNSMVHGFCRACFRCLDFRHAGLSVLLSLSNSAFVAVRYDSGPYTGCRVSCIYSDQGVCS